MNRKSRKQKARIEHKRENVLKIEQFDYISSL